MPKIIENVRGIILEKGKEMLLEGNYAEFNLRNLAKNCELGLGTFYNYFSSKEELAHNIFMNDWDKTLNLIDILLQETIPFKEKLFRIYMSLETFVSQYMDIFREMAGNEVKSCPHNPYLVLGEKMQELILVEKDRGGIESKVEIGKLSYFIVMNMLNCIKGGYMTFEELYSCLRV